MGLLRLLLSLGVVRAHTVFFTPAFFIQGGVAVIFFYIISGFYMSLIIKESYSKLGDKWEWTFLFNRALRLFPPYWLVLIVSVVVMPLMGTPTIFTTSLHLTPLEHALALFSNTFIVGLDVLVSGGLLHWHDSPGGIPLSWQAFVVFPAWTVAVELYFYVFAAFFIMRDRRTAYFALAIGAFIRIWFVLVNGKMLGFSKHGIGYAGDPWGYHYFGSDLIFFMLGYVAYEIYTDLKSRVEKDPGFIVPIRVAAIALGACLLVECFAFDGYQHIWDYESNEIWATIPFLVLFIPAIFMVTKRSKIDNFIALYSYPIYLCHVMATYIAEKLLHFPENKWTTLFSIFLFSSLIVFAVEIPVDRLRHRFTFERVRDVPENANALITSG